MRTFLLRHRRGASEAIHVTLAAVALAFAFLLRFEFALDAEYRGMLLFALPLVLGVKLAAFRAFALRDLAWRYIGFEDLTRLAAANAAASAAATVLLRAAVGSGFPRSIYVLDALLCLTLMTLLRAAARKLFDRRRPEREFPTGAMRKTRRIVIYGAGQAGRMLLGEIRAHPRLGLEVAGFLDDDPAKRDLWLNGERVLGGLAELGAVVRRERVDEVLLALPSASGAEITAILGQCRHAHVGIRKIPPLAQLIETRVLVEQIREVRVDDLLGRPPVLLEGSAIGAGLTDKIVLVTGAGGSIGSELCRQIAHFRPGAIVAFDHAETSLYHLQQELVKQFPQLVFYPEVGTIQNRRRVREVFCEYRPETVYHAAAYKHVPMMEGHLFEAVENNVFGTHNLARAATAFGAGSFVLVSSDKAVRPANIMGASKRMAELVCLAAGSASSRTRFLAVRFGNVLGSNGSVIPLFQKQIAAGGPLTVTHPEMRRFIMTIPEAAQLVLQAAAMGAGGEVFVLEMGEPVRIVDLARKMVLLSGLKPDEDIRIEFSGIRPGEKLFEELSAYEEDTVPTPHRQIRVFTGKGAPREVMARCLTDLRRSIRARDADSVLRCIKGLIPGYHPSDAALRRAFVSVTRRASSSVTRRALRGATLRASGGAARPDYQDQPRRAAVGAG